MSTFKPDLIASSLASDLDSCTGTGTTTNASVLKNKNNNNNSNSNKGGQLQSPNTTEDEDNRLAVENKNAQNNRHSLNGQQLQQLSQVQIHITDTNSKDLTSASVKRRSKPSGGGGENTENNQRNSVVLRGEKKSPGLYSEPVDSIAFRRFGNHRHSEPNIRWSQPVLSLVKLDFGGGGGGAINGNGGGGGGLSEDESRVETVGTGKGKIALLQKRLQERREQQSGIITTKSYHHHLHHHQNISTSQHHILSNSGRKSAANVNTVGSELIVNREMMEEVTKSDWSNGNGRTAGSVDNLYSSNPNAKQQLLRMRKQDRISDTAHPQRKSQQNSGKF